MVLMDARSKIDSPLFVENAPIIWMGDCISSQEIRAYLANRNLVEHDARSDLRGLHYLHSHTIIHEDLECENFFVNGNSAELKIGGLALASVMHSPSSGVGTPELVYQLFDIHSFGMCMLELVSCENLYGECKSQAQIYKVMSGLMKPTALERVNDPQGLICDPLVPIKVPKSGSIPTDIDTSNKPFSSRVSVVRIRGEKVDDISVSLTLRVANLCGQVNTIEFKFDLDTDTVPSIAGEMVEQLNFLSKDDKPSLVKLMDRLIDKLVPNWKNSSGNGLTDSYGNSAVLQHDQNSQSLSVLRSDDENTDQHKKGSVRGNVISSQPMKDSEIPSAASSSALSKEMSLLSLFSPSEADDDRLKLKLNGIEMEYYQRLRELLRMREDAIYDASQRCIKKN
ncbi:probable serine/threonine-protein kinase WNK9 [Cornus florida]|uniref:probable serine/threonine-protein kinase WNK9 n=1 Tax=Cornus florida TaxID=4283 RepID=UPI00289CFD87|nr:probable serine/threonine-protein kinase WNK9 [Cornus florida]